MFKFLRNQQTVFYSSWTILYTQQQCMTVPLSPNLFHILFSQICLCTFPAPSVEVVIILADSLLGASHSSFSSLIQVKLVPRNVPSIDMSICSSWQLCPKAENFPSNLGKVAMKKFWVFFLTPNSKKIYFQIHKVPKIFIYLLQPEFHIGLAQGCHYYALMENCTESYWNEREAI